MFKDICKWYLLPLIHDLSYDNPTDGSFLVLILSYILLFFAKSSVPKVLMTHAHLGMKYITSLPPLFQSPLLVYLGLLSLSFFSSPGNTEDLRGSPFSNAAVTHSRKLRPVIATITKDDFREIKWDATLLVVSKSTSY